MVRISSLQLLYLNRLCSNNGRGGKDEGFLGVLGEYYLKYSSDNNLYLTLGVSHIYSHHFTW